jgi:alkanesulfonate monooxygenase SsuD/methylene tetrahydromethanopterin reductase-like flavin-dependent oxidoreductase (luciferase family)
MSGPGVFTWEAVWGESAWVTLGAAAMATGRIRLGTLLTPAARWRPWDLASAVGTVDRLSGGRVVMSVGLGAPHEGWTAFEPDEGRRVRAGKLDECLAIYDGLMRGQPFSYDGTYYRARPTGHMVPEPPVQRPRPPVWVVGAKVAGRGRQPSLERAARWDGLLPAFIDKAAPEPADPTLDQFAAVVAEVRAMRAGAGLGAPYDVVTEADSSGPEGTAELRRRIEAGPPRQRHRVTSNCSPPAVNPTTLPRWSRCQPVGRRLAIVRRTDLSATPGSLRRTCS